MTKLFLTILLIVTSISASAEESILKVNFIVYETYRASYYIDAALGQTKVTNRRYYKYHNKPYRYRFHRPRYRSYGYRNYEYQYRHPYYDSKYQYRYGKRYRHRFNYSH